MILSAFRSHTCLDVPKLETRELSPMYQLSSVQDSNSSTLPSSLCPRAYCKPIQYITGAPGARQQSQVQSSCGDRH